MIRTGDHVRHIPSGETWVVAFVEDHTGLLCACGWPCELVPIAQCQLVKQASDEESLALVRKLAAISEPDIRRSWAQRWLASNRVEVG